ncbi:ElyC/SanA/YdcF family protein [Halarcobacter sp.]|uniref:ElyC/SanA/YdcF family protein n=1 Tax=Halarcobacter sp. TaxID=2321133 RepID=UPI003A8DD089
MLFTLKKLISAFLMPLSIGLTLFIIGLFYLLIQKQNRANFFIIIAFLWTALIAYSPFSNAMIQPLENKYPSYLKVDKSINYVLVLGSGHINNENLSDVSQLSKTALMRLSEGIRIYKELDDAKLILSGYKDDQKLSNAQMMKNVALKFGVNEENIILHEKAKDTKEESSYTKETLEKEPFILVTSAAHMPRAMKIFEANWLNPIAAPTDYLSKNEGSYLSVPKASNLKKTESAMHEYLGIIWHTITEKTKFLTD